MCQNFSGEARSRLDAAYGRVNGRSRLLSRLLREKSTFTRSLHPRTPPVYIDENRKLSRTSVNAQRLNLLPKNSHPLPPLIIHPSPKHPTAVEVRHHVSLPIFLPVDADDPTLTFTSNMPSVFSGLL